MISPPRLFDPRLLARRAARARLLRERRPGADFLLLHALDDFRARLGAVKRPFPVAADLFTPGTEPPCDAAGRFTLRVRPAWDGSGSGTVVADAESLPLAPASFDLAVSLLALQWCEDLPGLLAQVRAALRPDGLFLACLVGGHSLHELRTAFTQAESEGEGGVSPRVIPFVDVRAAGALLQRAGFALPVVDVDTLLVRYDSMFDLVADLRATGATNPLHERSRRPLKRGTLARAAQIYAERFSDPDGRVRATFDLVWLSGWAPHESQQKPLKPGSATHSLAEALGVSAGSRSDKGAS